MKIGTREKDGVVILDLEGSIDINASDFIEAVGGALKAGSKKILCNFKGIVSVDYIGVSVLAIIYKNVLNHKGTIKFCNISPHVSRLFSIVGLNRVLECYDTEKTALHSFKEEEVIVNILKKKLRRRFKRIPFKSTVEYRPKKSLQDFFYRGKLLNLSGIGAFIIGEKMFAEGTLLQLRLYLLPKPGIIDVDAKVVWFSRPHDQPLEYPAMGLEFKDITAEKQKLIVEFVERNIANSNL